MPSADLVLKYIEVLKWPVTLLILLLIYRKAITSLLTSVLPKSKIKISLFGVEIETTLSELKSISLASLGGSLKVKQLDLLRRLGSEGAIHYGPEGILGDQCKLIRPMRIGRTHLKFLK
jgi:hypothetical protein